jgi:hypothetical protein
MAIGLHAALLVALTLPIRFEADAPVAAQAPSGWEDILRVTPVELPRPQPPKASASMERRPAGMLEAGVVPAMAAEAPADVRAEGRADAPVARALVYLDDDARALLPYEPLYSARKPQREGDWHTPGDGSEDDIFYRPLALEPNTTRFARAWRPTRSLGGEWLEKLVETTTGTVSIPLNAKFNLVCVGSIAGLGGGCLIVRNAGSDVVVARPPPPPWERANRVQCRELREQLAAADEAERIAWLLDRLGALCIDAAAPETTKPGAGPGSGA